MLSSLSIVVASNSTTLELAGEEMYQIQILAATEVPELENARQNEYIAFLYAENCYGAIRGLETFSQLIQPIQDTDSSYYTYHITDVPLTIHDRPRFYWRFVYRLVYLAPLNFSV